MPLSQGNGTTWLNEFTQLKILVGQQAAGPFFIGAVAIGVKTNMILEFYCKSTFQYLPTTYLLTIYVPTK